jgi:3-hydroxybutyryl-CoA dehydrogenase
MRAVTVLGGGTMGAGIAGHFARHGLDVTLVDASPELAERARDRLLARTRGHVEAGLLGTDAVERTASIAVADAIGAADLVIEAVPEDLELKRRVLGAIEPGPIVATNTSSLPIGELAESVRAPERFLGVHWFNPPEWTPGIEVIPTPGTDRAVVDAVLELLRAAGKRPAVVADRAGFIANRLQSALLREALACVEEGLATPEAIDEVVRSSFGFRLPFYGPFQIADMAGLDVYESVFRTLERDLGPEFAPPRALREQVARGRLGTKTGAGFAEHPDPDALVQERDRRYAALAALLRELDAGVVGE